MEKTRLEKAQRSMPCHRKKKAEKLEWTMKNFARGPVQDWRTLEPQEGIVFKDAMAPETFEKSAGSMPPRDLLVLARDTPDVRDTAGPQSEWQWQLQELAPPSEKTGSRRKSSSS